MEYYYVTPSYLKKISHLELVNLLIAVSSEEFETDREVSLIKDEIMLRLWETNEN